MEKELWDVIIVGAGLSGVGAARHLQRYCPEHKFLMLESRAAMGGTWDFFKYPGIRSDSDMHTLGYPFKPWKDKNAIADGPSILRYIHETATEGNLQQHLRLEHKVLKADWSSADACWSLHINTPTGPTLLRTRFLYMCSGYYNYKEAYLPSFEGQEQFKGLAFHPQFWPDNLEVSGKNITVLGSGATAVTLVPELVARGAKVTMLQRSPTYVMTAPSQDKLSLALRRTLPEGLAYTITRWKNILIGMAFFQFTQIFPSAAKRWLVKQAGAELKDQESAQMHFSPSYNPWNQRLCLAPDSNLFKVLREKQARIVTDTVKRFEADGLRLSSGELLRSDIVVLATGLKLNLLGDVRFAIDGAHYNPTEATAYKGMMLSDLPNCALAFGYTNASWTLKADLTASYVCRLLNYMKAKGFRRAAPARDASVKRKPLLDFSSGYVQRAAAILPSQGHKKPWQVYQNYFQDMLTIRYGRLSDSVMQFRK